MTPHTNHDSEEAKLRQHSSQQERQPEAQLPSAGAPDMAGRIPLSRNTVGRTSRAVQRFVQNGTLMTGPADDEPLVKEASITEGVVNSHEAQQERVPVQRFWDGLMDMFSGEDEYKPVVGGLMDPLSPMPKSGGGGSISDMIKKLGIGTLKGGGSMEPGTLKGGGLLDPLDPSAPYPKPKSGGMVGGIADVLKKLNPGGIKGGSMEPGTLKGGDYNEPGTLKGGGYYEPGTLKGGGFMPMKPGGGTSLPPTGFLSPEEWEAM